MGTLEASRDLEPGQVVSRAVPDPGPTAEPGDRAVMADQGPQAAMADPGTQAAMEGSPPQKKYSWGSSSSLGGTLEAWKESWTGPAEAKVSRTGPAEAKVSRTGPAEAKVSWMGPVEALTPRGARVALTLVGALPSF